MSKRTIYVINANNGAFVNIPATQATRRAIIREVPDPANPANAFNPQGLRYKLPDDNFTQLYRGVPGAPLELSEGLAAQNAKGAIIGFPAQSTGDGTAIAATVLAKVLSDTATATVIEIEEES